MCASLVQLEDPLGVTLAQSRLLSVTDFGNSSQSDRGRIGWSSTNAPKFPTTVPWGGGRLSDTIKDCSSSEEEDRDEGRSSCAVVRTRGPFF